MATTNNIWIPNVAKGVGSDSAWPHIWALSRAMKKAGWKYLASGDDLSKDVRSDPALDLWSPTELVNCTKVWQVNDNAGPSFVDITTAANDVTTNDTILYPATDEIGDWVAIGFSTPFPRIQVDTTGGVQGVTGVVVWEYWNGSAWTALSDVTDGTNSFKAVVGVNMVSWTIPTNWASTSVNGFAAYYVRARSTTAFSTNPVADRIRIIIVDSDAGVTANTGAAASIGAIANGRALITGLTGMAAASKGRFLLLSGAASAINNNMHQIEEVVSATSVRVDARNFAMVGSDANNGAISWKEVDPTLEVYPTRLNTVRGWSVWRGPSTIKVPITSAPVAGPNGFNFIRGENVVEATTGAEGEYIGHTFDGTSTGWLVIMPRIIGNGANPFGWGTGNVITGETSGATVTQNGAALEYRHNVVIGRGTTPDDNGHLFVQTIEPVSEAAHNFYALATSAGCTPDVPPGCGGTGNAFPALGWSFCGSGDSAAGANWHGSNGAFPMGNGHAIAMDAIWESDYSADGSFIWVGHHTSHTLACRAFLRMDDTEEGDLDPYATFGISATTLYQSAGRAVGAQSSSLGSVDYMNTTSFDSLGTSHSVFKGWRRRGFPTEDAYQSLEPGIQYVLVSANDTPVSEANPGTTEKVACSLQTKKTREPVRLVSTQIDAKMRKGTVRHFSMLQGGFGGLTYDQGRYLQLSNTDASIVVPWNGVTQPLPA